MEAKTTRRMVTWFSSQLRRWIPSLGLKNVAEVRKLYNRRHFVSALRYDLRVETPAEFLDSLKKAK